MPHSRARRSKPRRDETGRHDSIEDFYRQLRWTRAAPAQVRRTAADGDLAALACVLGEHLTDRQCPRSLGAIAERANPYLWSLAKPGEVAGALQQLLGTEATRPIIGERSFASRNGKAGAAGKARSDSLPAVLALLCCADLLACEPTAWLPEKFLATLKQLIGAAVGAAESDAALERADLANLVLRHGELPWSIAILWPELRSARHLVAPARRAFEVGLTRLCGRDGVPHPRHLGVLPLVLGSFCRSLWLGREAEVALWRTPLDRRWRHLLLNTLRLYQTSEALPLVDRSQSAPPLSLSVAGELDEELIEALMAVSGDPPCRAAWAGLRGSRRRGRAPEARAVKSSVQSDDARLSVLRAQWQRGGSMLVARHDRHPLEFDLSIRGERVLSGPWRFQLHADGKKLGAPKECHAVCWMADDDVIYLELRMKWTAGFVLERQMLLGRREPFALLADAVKTRRKCTLNYLGSMTLADGVGGRTERRSRTGWLQRPGKRRCWVVPLGLQQWRVERSAGALELDGDQLRLQASSTGNGLYAPLFLHAYPVRAERIDWRALTVTQARRALAPDRAVGYRIRFGPKRQLLLYRSLGPRGTRAVLGHQTKCEFVFGWFDRDGDLEPLLEVM